jgi:hypothetical protein
MSLTPLAPRDYGSLVPVPGRPLRPILVAAALLLSCAKGATLPDAPRDVLHYPAWIATLGDQLLVVNLDQDLAYDNGALVAIDASTTSATSGRILGGIPLPNMAGQVHLVQDAAGAGVDPSRFAICAENLDAGYRPLPLALVAGRFQTALFAAQLTPGAAPPFSGDARRIDLNPFSAAVPFGLAFTCGADGIPRAWVSYLSGQANTGYVAQVDLSKPPGAPGSVVQVNVGKGEPRSFAFDAVHERLYFTGKEYSQAAPVRWIEAGNACLPFPDGLQDERQGGCHVDRGFDLSLQFRGAEPNEIQLATADANGTPFDCTAPGFAGMKCPRMYLSVRMYDADLAAFLGSRPSNDIGGKLMVVELPEGGVGRPAPQVVAEQDIGMMAGDVRLIPRPGKRPLVAITAIDDDLLWIYDDDIGAMVKVFGRDARGVPALGHLPSAIATQLVDGGATVRLFVTSYQDNWVSAVDLPLDAPGDGYVVHQGPNPRDPAQPFLRWPGTQGVTP